MYVTASVDDFFAEHRAIEYFPAVHAENFIGLKWVNVDSNPWVLWDLSRRDSAHFRNAEGTATRRAREARENGEANEGDHRLSQPAGFVCDKRVMSRSQRKGPSGIIGQSPRGRWLSPR